MSSEISCVGCGARVPDVQAPGHRYIGCSPGCWALFGEVLAREYSDFRYARVHGLTVDAYAVQHPGEPSAHAIASVGLHLQRLHWVLELGYDGVRATRVMQRAAERKRELTWLEPPAERGSMTVVDVQRATTPEEHVERVRAWAAEVWQAWSVHHETVRHWARLVEEAAHR
ncbi:MAG TPA: DUF5946 family protein [Candidatus Eisenbacteria bacterium]|nr:DUF5946 family protein [Candidatus Eisenbacteria bacterium]